jgi:signal transduction histidine kinase/FixJ family two-component response regulator
MSQTTDTEISTTTNAFAQRAQLVLQNGAMALLTTALIGALLVAALWMRVPQTLLLNWLFGLLGIVTVRGVVLLAWHRLHPAAETLHLWLLLHGVGSTLSALWWGTIIYWFQQPDVVTAVVLAFALGGIALGGLAAIGPLLRIYVPFLFGTLGPIAVHFLAIRGEPGMAGLGAMLVAFIFALTLLAATQRAALIRTFTLAASLAAEKKRAEEGSRAKSEFLAYISHEIRTPMNGVLGMTEILLESPLDHDQRHLANTILRSGKSLLSVINDVLDISKIEAGKLSLERRAFDPAQMVASQVDLFGELANRKHLEVRVDVAPNLPRRVLGDQQRFGQIIANLVSNALKFTQTGYVHLHLSMEKIKAEAAGDVDALYLILTVADSGIGIAPAALQRVFEIFEQADVSTSRRFGGTGLGLAICKKLAQMMDGSIDVQSELGKGTRFTVRIKVARVEENQRVLSFGETGAAASTQTARLAARVLLAEDNAVNQELIKRMLEALGCSVVIVGNGAEAVEQVKREPWDAILMDSDMPEMGGVEATTIIRSWEKSESRAPIPIIAITANAMMEDRQRYLDVGMNDYLIKPFSKQQLLELLMAYVSLTAEPAANAGAGNSEKMVP